MSVGRVEILPVVTNGPYTYTFKINGAAQKTEINMASISACIDAAKPQVGAMPGTITSVIIIVNTDAVTP